MSDGTESETSAGSAGVYEVTNLEDAFEVLRSRAMAPILPESGHGAQYVAQLVGGSLAHLHGKDHLGRRRILTSLFRGPNLRRRESEILRPAFDAELHRIRNTDPRDPASFDLLSSCRRIFTVVMADLVGLTGLDTEKALQDFEHDFVLVERGTRAKWGDDPQAFVEIAVGAQRRIVERHFQPAWERMSDSPAQGGPENLMRTMFRHRDHYAEWDPGIFIREMTLFMAASVGSSANAVCHAIMDIELWASHHPEMATGHDFVAAAFSESVRLHQTNPLLRTALENLILPSGILVKAGSVVSVNRAALNLEMTGSDQDAFKPGREVGSDQPPYGLGFGAGSHICIGKRMMLGDGDPLSDQNPQGAAVLVTRWFLENGVLLDPNDPPEIFDDMSRETWKRFPALLPADRRAPVTQG